MAGANMNRVILTGNLTRDPSLKTVGSTELVELRVAVNSRVKRNNEWVDKPNYLNVTVFGAQAKPIKQYLAKGSPVAVDGRLDWREWDKDDQHFEAVQIIADSVQFLPDGKRDSDGGAPASVPAVREDEDIPF